MKTFTAIFLFAFSVLGVVRSLEARAALNPHIEIRPSVPALVPEDEDGKDDKEGEEEEEEIFPYKALELVDPGALDHVLLLQAAMLSDP
jgi:hypothetical protein